jgi:hypothetical protein
VGWLTSRRTHASRDRRDELETIDQGRSTLIGAPKSRPHTHVGDAPAHRLDNPAVSTPSRAYGSVGLVIDAPVSKTEFCRRFDRDPSNTATITGLGDMAFVHACGGLHVLEGDVVVAVGVQHFATCERTEVVLRAVAEAALGQLSPQA